MTAAGPWWSHRWRATLMLAVCLGLALPTAGRAACRQALVLALDVSGSVDSREYALQVDGLANALSHPEVREALLSTPEAPVALAVFEWSGPRTQRLLADWVLIDGPETLSSLVTRLRAVRRLEGDPATALGSAIQTGMALLDRVPACWRETLDISGDGKHNTGPHPRALQPGLPAELTINGLVIGTDAETTGDRRVDGIGALIGYYRAYVIHGPDAFVESALGFETFEAAMVRKLIRELQSMVIGRAPRAPASARREPQ